MSDKQQSAHMINGQLSQIPDTDPEETREWLDSVDDLIDTNGNERARFLLGTMEEHARGRGVSIPPELTTPYINTIPASAEPEYPGDEELERQFRMWTRWNAAVMVTRAQRPGVGVGGHISSYAAQATLYEVGQNHFFRGPDAPGGGDQVFFQGHSSPGNYARAYLEGRLTEADLDSFRQEASRPSGGRGLPSYPHPHQMQDFWQFPTVSLGIGPATSIYQAWFNRYLHERGIKDTSDQHVWAFVGDGEMDEPESRGMLQLAAYQKLDNLTWVVNCNLQRLDGPVRGNGSIVQELEAFFKGAGWNVIKVLWGREWDPLLAADKEHALVDLMGSTLDGDYQGFKANDGAYVRNNFFGRDPRTKALVADMSDDQIWALRRGGHDSHKIYAAYRAALAHKGQPTVILAQTVKGYDLGTAFAGRNSNHQMKKLNSADLKLLRDTTGVPIEDSQLENPYAAPYYKPPEDHPAMVYMREHRAQLGGDIPQRRVHQGGIQMPKEKPFESMKKGSGKQKVATTMALVRLLKDLIRDKNFGYRLVPIVPDEARTFGMDSMFPSQKIFNTLGQNYTAVDHDMLLSYKESTQGQLLHTGITEAGSVAAYTAAGTSYSVHDLPMIPFYIFYSMFGFQRTGDQFWAATDALARGFIIGATAGRTTLTGEGSQHMDGHSPVIASTNPSVIIYDPAYAYEIGHIFKDGLVRMYGDGSDGRDQNVQYYLTVYNEPIHQPAEPENVDVEGIIKGIYKLEDADGLGGPRVNLLASGVGVPWAREAKKMLRRDWGVDATVWSVTSWYELRRDGLETNEYNYLHPTEQPREAYVTAKLKNEQGPFIATSDFEHQVQDSIREWVPGQYETLGANGVGISDTRPAARRYFKIDDATMVVRALYALAKNGQIDRSVVQQAIEKYDINNPQAAEPVPDNDPE
ncbi:pyruvate dehydrogenase E1 component [Actinobaculum suis]|uniref:Pyruvate dehydrogenase E1 component n=2 Tax=Actinobaculum suis TaxID=1657 RepID=A0A0K9ESX3_9ACTO|nr:pyruvate dehydrogenase (acetyl-transferring), homodimeric type [Actinobaculum suis]KMY22897.1 pyruvate dehydrogenase [Actinobaculum suis]MDY5153817.1 pyruvate dehydrogenase (acetyl-transferring), homodimeric type [Actinobaculum suis]OCA93947.1 pyruvate dehydrogenase (acetyl-transferring), homodimeric type [Actinobaculum suis]OCA94412.1 pyruvate dehydrogenase (acetyl-transferring), homodimeric type [Actinobaculum suis]SDE29494.1 pyruvate dehydrogenase E1 component [Actinobaculum suis]